MLEDDMNDIKVKNYSFKKLRNAWETLYNNNANLSYNQSYLWAKYLHEYSQSNLLKRMAFGKCRYVCVVDKDDILLIAPLVIKNREAKLLGEKCAMDYFDYIYDNRVNEKHFKAVGEYINHKYNVNCIRMQLLNGKSDTLKYCNTAKLVESFNVCLQLEFNAIDDYIANLSKSTRQNFRTANNRAASDNANITYEHYVGRIDTQLAKELIKLHQKRLNERYPQRNDGIYGTKFYSLLRRLICGKYVKDTQIFKIMTTATLDTYTSVVKINDGIAAFYFGLKTNDRGISLIRVCINSDYAKYSPGMLLGIEMVKRYLGKIDYLDFTCDGEEYKYKLGAINKICYGVEIEI